jgi:galactokinase
MSVAFVACGDSGPSREDYIAKADAFCKERNAEAKERNEKLQQIATSAKTEDEFFDEATPELEDGLEWTRDGQEEFKDIEAPEADQETIDKLVAATDDEIAVLEKVVEAAKARDFERFGDLINDQQNIDERANEIAQDYGLKECGSEANEADSS